MNGNPTLTLVKIGGNILNDESALKEVLDQFARIDGAKVLVHGGGRAATELAAKLNVPQTLIEGRRVTDAETLKIAILVYAGLINKTIVTQLQARGVDALGITGADLDLIRAKKRAESPVDFGFVGDITAVDVTRLLPLMGAGAAPVVAPLTHDGRGQLLNTNADTIANALAGALSSHYRVRLIYSFEREGVEVGPASMPLPEITKTDFLRLKTEGAVTGGMIPKLENAFKAVDAGAAEVVIGNAKHLDRLLNGASGTRVIHEN